MHELSVAENILEIVRQNVPQGEEQNVKSIKLRIGAFSGIVPDSLEFCFSAITEGTLLKGALLDIEHIPLTGLCNTCATTDRLEYGIFVCPSCGSGDIKLLSGTELQVVEIEISD